MMHYGKVAVITRGAGSIGKVHATWNPDVADVNQPPHLLSRLYMNMTLRLSRRI